MNKSKLHGEIMNIQTGNIEDILKKMNLYTSYEAMNEMIELAYKIGHRDARHAAAELVLRHE